MKSLLACLALTLTPVPSEVDQALQSIESRGACMKLLSADVTYRKDDEFAETSDLRTGRLIFDRSSETPSVGIQFTHRTDLIKRERRPEHSRWIFSPGWAIEFDRKRKLVSRTQTAPPEDPEDPWSLSGRFPLPLGQQRDEVLANYAAELIVAPPKSLPRREESKVTGIRLIPRAGRPSADQWKQVDLWYDAKTWLPIGMIATRKSGEVQQVYLRNIMTPAALESQDSLMMQVETPEGWTEDVQKWQAPSPE